MSDPLLPFLGLDAAALLVVGVFTARLPFGASGFLTTILTGLGGLLCLPSLLMRTSPTALTLPIGPPGLSLHLALDPLSAVFLLLTLAAASAIAIAVGRLADPVETRASALATGGTILTLLAADGMTVAIGLAITATAIGRRRLAWCPIAILAAIALLTPPGETSSFEAIRTMIASPVRTAAAAALTVATALAWPYPAPRTGPTDAIGPALFAPVAAYLLLRLNADLQQPQPIWGTLLLLVGAAMSVAQAWRAAGDSDITTATAALAHRHAGVATAAIGLTVIARATDLPAAAILTLNAAFLSIVGTSLAGTLVTLAAQAIAANAGTRHLSRLGGLIHLMPLTATALSLGLLALTALPPGVGFAALWLVFQAVLSGPRTGFLLTQLPLAIAAALFALSAALATAATVRIIGIALLGRPRSPVGAGATEAAAPLPGVLLTLTGACLLAGLLPGPLLWLLTAPSSTALLGAAEPFRLFSVSGATHAYLPLPVFALLALSAGAILMLRGHRRSGADSAGPWLDGMQAETNLPFGEPTAQSAGAGFRPPLPAFTYPTLPRLRAVQPPSTASGLWLVLAAFAAFLLTMAALL